LEKLGFWLARPLAGHLLAATIDSMNADHHRFLFIGGLHRSGTSIVHHVLREHSQISGFSGTGAPEDEGMHLQGVFPTAVPHGGPGKFAFDPEAHLTELSALVSEANRIRLFDAWSSHWDLDRPILLEKSPPNIIRMRFLQALFPGARFVILLRHPLATSLATQKLTGFSLSSLLQHWLTAHRIMAEDSQHIDRLFIIRYERLVHKPAGVLRDLFRFIDCEPDYGNISLFEDRNVDYFQTWRDWNTSPEYRPAAGDLSSRYEEGVQEFGYSLVEPTRYSEWDGGGE
jgi:hypothetical protein